MGKVLVGLVTYDGHAGYVQQVLQSIDEQTVDVEVVICNTTGENAGYQRVLEGAGKKVLVATGASRKERIVNGRKAVVSEFLRSDATHLCWVDTDSVLPRDALERLLGDEKDVVGGSCLTPIVVNGELVVGMAAYTNTKGSEGVMLPFAALFATRLLMVDMIGFGTCCLVRRRVVEEVPLRFVDGVGEDFQFCLDARKKGFSIFLDTSVWVEHYKWPLGDPRNNLLSIPIIARQLGFIK